MAGTWGEMGTNPQLPTLRNQGFVDDHLAHNAIGVESGKCESYGFGGREEKNFEEEGRKRDRVWRCTGRERADSMGFNLPQVLEITHKSMKLKVYKGQSKGESKCEGK